MLQAEEQIKNNVAEYVLYLWQMEDLLRGINFDLDKIADIITSQNQDINLRRELYRYELFIAEMKQDGVLKSGHIKRSLAYIAELTYLHQNLLLVKKDEDYFKLYQAAIKNIEDFAAKAGDAKISEVEACLQALYGLLVLRLKKEEVSKATLMAMKTFSELLAYLAAKYNELAAR